MSEFAKRMMAQKLMAESRDDPFSDSQFFNAPPMLSPDDMMLSGPQGGASGTVTPGQVAYGVGATGALFAPGAGVADVMGFAPDPFNQGQMLPSFAENIRGGQFVDAGLQTLGVAGDVLQAGGAVFPPLVAAGTALKAPRAAKVAGAAMDAADATQARYFDAENFEPPTADNPVSIVPPTETESGIIAFHGSGADFDEFRLDMIGTGEGAQAYGYGLYFTDSEDIAKFYKDTVGQERNQIQFKGKPLDSVYTADIYENFGDDISEIIQKAKEMGVAGGDEEIIEDAVIGVFANLSQGLSNMKDAQAAVDSLRSGRSTGFSPEKTIYRYFIEPEVKEADIPEGKMYKVALSPKPDELLDYDRSLSEQSDSVQEKAKKVLSLLYPDVKNPALSMRGSDLQKQIENRVAVSRGNIEKMSDPIDADINRIDPNNQKSEAAIAAQIMSEAGIPGIKYRAAGSRGAAPTQSTDKILVNGEKFETKDKLEKIAVHTLALRNNRIAGVMQSVKDEKLSKADQNKVVKIAQKFLDDGKKATFKIENNYVIFDDKAIKIMEKYGIVGPVAVTAAGTAAVNRGRNDNDNDGSIFTDAGMM